MYTSDQKCGQVHRESAIFFPEPPQLEQVARQNSSGAKGAQPHRSPFFPSHFTGFGTIPGLGWEGQQFFGNRTHLVQLSPRAESALGSVLSSSEVTDLFPSGPAQ